MVKSIRGMSLIELMIVVVIVSILAAIAYPSYRQYVSKSKRNEAKAALLLIATNQERHYLDNNLYTTDLALVGIDNAITDSGTYEVEITAADANGFTAVAEYLGNDAAEAARCDTFGIDATGAKTAGPNPVCWTSTQ
ncbi:MAG TPA: type IV pilin protein [Woeseiaceae bacterium]|nr:type IV pilin protein [Woeseiaceae bacterium]